MSREIRPFSVSANVESASSLTQKNGAATGRTRKRYGRRMLIVAGSILTEDDGRDVFLTAVKPMVAATLEEPGCCEYAFTPDPNDPNRILLYELWDDQDALDGHFVSDHMAQWQQDSKGLPVVGADIKKYTISEVGPVR